MSGVESPKEAAETRTAIANAEAAEVDARRKVREEEEDTTPAAKAQREAEREKGAAQATNDAATAQRTEVASLVPDLSKVDRGQLDAGSQPLFGATLAQAALKDASRALVRRLSVVITAEQDARVRLLITSDASLVDSDAIYRQVLGGTEWLDATSEALLEALAPPTRRLRRPNSSRPLLCSAPSQLQFQVSCHSFPRTGRSRR